MSRNVKKFITIFLSAVMMVMILSGTKVFAEDEVGVYNPEPKVYVLVPGETTKLKVPVRSVGTTISSPEILADASGTPYTVSQPVLRTGNLDVPFNSIYEFLDQYIEFDVTVDETAEIGVYQIKLLIEGKDDSGENVSAELAVKTQILEEREPAQLAVYDIKYDNAIIGKKMNLSFTVRNEGEITARNVYLSIDYGDTGMAAGYSTKNIKIKDLGKQEDTQVTLPIKVLSTAKPGMNTLTVNFTYKNSKGKSNTDSQEIYINLKENDSAPELVLDSFKYKENVKPGQKLGLIVKIKNEGKSKAYDLKLSVDESSLGTSKFIKDYYTDYIELADIGAGSTHKAEIPLLVSKEATGGLKDLKLNLVYYDEQGVEYQSSITIYPDIKTEGVTENGTPVVIISNVKQTPQNPEAGGSLAVSFDIENKSAMDLSDFKIGISNLANSSFIPVGSDPYKYIGVLKAGTSKKVTMNMTVSEEAADGLNILTLGYTYAGGGDTVDIPVLNVKNELGSASKPKLIISNYEVDVEELKAGSVFNFSFEIHNTHSSVAAKNIIITVSGKPEGSQTEIFSVTQGSNSFFVKKIGPGETYSNSLEMKVRSDAATAAYPITVTIEYEYDGIEPNPTTGEIGETVTHELLLQVVENARPVVDYVNVYSYDGQVMMGSPANLGFEFYNMGKSTLNNVIARVEGDFTSTAGDMYFIGNVAAGESAYAEFEVIPNVEGTAKGVVKITYEDSNGDEQVYTKEFEAPVMGALPTEPWETGDFNGEDMGAFNPSVEQPKKPILPTWAFVLLLIAIFVIFVPVTYKVIISIYKSRLRKKEDEMLQ